MAHQPITALGKIDAYISQQIEQRFICGVVLLIAQDNQVIYEKAFGYAQKYKIENVLPVNEAHSYLEKMRLYKTPLLKPVSLTTDHLFDIASITKVIATTMGIMLLLDQHKLTLDDPIKKYLPAFAKSDKKRITIRHLLMHTSGLSAWKPLYYHLKQADDAVAFISDLPLAYAIDSERRYSDLGFIILRYMIEEIANEPFADFLHKHLYQKLNLKNTLFNPNPAQYKIASTSHGNPYEYKMIAYPHFGYPCDENIHTFHGWRHYTLTGEVNDANTHHVFSGISAHSGLFSTASEVNCLLQLMLNGGRYHQLSLFQPETVQAFMTKNKYQQGLGWAMSCGQGAGTLPLGEAASHPFLEGVFGHTGFTGTLALALPAKQASIVLLTNNQHLGVNEEGRYNNLKPFYEHIIAIIMQVLNKIA